MDWLVSTSLSIEEAWSIFEGALILVTFPFIPCTVPCRPNNCPPLITKRVKKDVIIRLSLQALDSTDLLAVRLETHAGW